jgi:hypothetical protein
VLSTPISELFDGSLDVSALGVDRIEIQNNQDNAVPRSCHFAVEKQRLIVDRMEPEIFIKMERSVLTPDAI